MKRIVQAVTIGGLVLMTAGVSSAEVPVDDLYERVEHGYADSDGVRVHYVTIGEGPLVLFIHGFPDQW